ncbi:hypothetical protein [Terracidiphilus gabretensis]|uniref:hypothetical protein n=1 Tax=Terracidiphilus gabretensis TaxID=1577687 RepID=UPI00071B49B0|nr:hypothetical protein [Terracidiphilus gabretensis]
MILGLSAGLFTGIHVVLSLLGILAGFLLLGTLIGRKKHTFWTPVFFVANILTDVTGFLFPFKGITPGIILGVLSLVALLVAGVAVSNKKLRGLYVSAVATALFFNVFVLIVQSFEKIGFLKSIAPTQASPVFGITQLAALVLIILLAVTAWRRFRSII